MPHQYHEHHHMKFDELILLINWKIGQARDPRLIFIDALLLWNKQPICCNRQRETKEANFMAEPYHIIEQLSKFPITMIFKKAFLHRIVKEFLAHRKQVISYAIDLVITIQDDKN